MEKEMKKASPAGLAQELEKMGYTVVACGISSFIRLPKTKFDHKLLTIQVTLGEDG